MHRSVRGADVPGPRTLRRYVAKRFLVSIIATFLVCAVLIFMIDMVELLRLSRRTSVSMLSLVWIIAALLSLNRRSELIVMRAGGMSVWQFLRPGMTVSLVLGVLAVTIYNPLAATARSQSERLVAEAFGREASLLRVAAPGRRRRPVGHERPGQRRPGPVAHRRGGLPVRP
jgi:lipopolysaccharide export system permease protein